MGKPEPTDYYAMGLEAARGLEGQESIAALLAQQSEILEDYVRSMPGGGFVCPRCRRLSCHPRDAVERYCGFCHEFFPA